MYSFVIVFLQGPLIVKQYLLDVKNNAAILGNAVLVGKEPSGELYSLSFPVTV